jgi:DNA repair protein RadA/Sms
MAKSRTVFVCQECGSQSPKWLGRCADCGAWNSFVEESAAVHDGAPATAHRYGLAGQSGTARLYSEIEIEQNARMSTGIDEFDRVLGGGIVPGSLVLVGGEPGIGKSSLLLQAAANMAASSGHVLYSSGEESEHQI